MKKAKRCNACGKVIAHWNQSGFCAYDYSKDLAKRRRLNNGP